MNSLVKAPTSDKPVLTQTEILREVSEVTEAREIVQEMYASKHAPNTRRNYDFHWNRFVNWCQDKTTRQRDPGIPEFSVMSLIPVTSEQLQEEYPFDGLEQVLLLYIASEFVAIAPENLSDKEAEEYIKENSIAPSSLSAILSALKSKIGDLQPRVKWEPSTVLTGSVTGMRRALGKVYGEARQATPLLLGHLEQLAQRLSANNEPLTVTIDRVLVEMIAAGITRAEIGRCTLDSIRGAGEYDVQMVDPNTGARWIEQGMFGRRIIIRGQNRKGGNQDKSTVYDLDQNRLLAGAIDTLLPVRPEGDHLIGESGKNITARINSSLNRIADSAGIDEDEWNPSMGQPSREVAQKMRKVIDEASYLDRSLTTRRHHAMLLVGYYGALRRSELCELTLGDITWRQQGNQRIVEVLIRQSKTDQEGQGQQVYLYPTGDLAPSYMDVVTVLTTWIETLEGLGASSSTPLFPTFTRQGEISKAVDDREWSMTLKALATEAELFGSTDSAATKKSYERVSGHSLRRGFVTTAILQGMDVIQIAKQTRHKNLQSLTVYADKVLASKTDWAAALYGVTDNKEVQKERADAATKQRDQALDEQERLKNEIERLQAQLAEFSEAV